MVAYREWLVHTSEKANCPFCWTRSAVSGTRGRNRCDRCKHRGENTILGECKWGSHVKDVDGLEQLVEKTENFFQWKNIGRSSICALRGVAGHKTHEGCQSPRQTGWATGMLLRTLEQIDDDLAAWTGSQVEK